MQKRLVILVAATVLSACEGNTLYAAEDLVKAQLRDPSSADFDDVKVYENADGGKSVVCGHVNSRNALGGMAGSQRFIVGGITVLEEQVGKEVMDGAWLKSCHGT